MTGDERPVDRLRLLAVALGLVLCLVAGSTPRVIGDGGEYLMQALNFADGEGPAIASGDMAALRTDVVGLAPALEDWQVTASTVEDDRGRHDFLHFWIYALLAAPFVWMADAIGASPLVGFVVLNLVMLTGALWLSVPRIGAAATLLLFGSPIVWWIDKPHTEIFTFTLLATALFTLRDRPWWAFVAIGAASTQNPPIAILLAPALLVQAPRGRAWLLDPRLLVGLAAGTFLALVHPAYSYDRHGVASLLMYAASDGIPSPAEWLAFLIDPVIGLIPNAPVFALGVVVAAVSIARSWQRGDDAGAFAFAAVALVVFVYSFARTTNFHHGGTPVISRYALWVIPLAIPLLWRLCERPTRVWRTVVWPVAIGSAAISVFAFHPSVDENAREPSWLAAWLWTAQPGWNNPLPEVFAESIARRENPDLPVITPGCEKILTVGRGEVGVWPIPCYPHPMPDACRAHGRSCYANLTPDGRYAFVPTPGRRQAAGRIARQRVWPGEAEAGARAVFDAMAWRHLAPDGPGADNLRAAHGVGAWVLAADDRLLVVLHRPEDGAVLRFRTPGPVTGQLIAPRTGAVVREIIEAGGPDSLWEVPVPAEHDILLLTLRRQAPVRNDS